MYSKKTLLLFCFLIFISCGEKNLKKETWHSEPNTSTTKIRITTNLSQLELENLILERIEKARFKVDRNYNNQISTLPRYVENYNMRIFYNIQGSTVTINGEYGFKGIYGVLEGGNVHSPGPYTIDWKEITYERTGWEIFWAIHHFSNSVTEFNQIN